MSDVLTIFFSFFLLLVCFCFLFSCFCFFFSSSTLHCLPLFFSFFTRRAVSGYFFFSFLLIFWGPWVFSDRLRGNPVRNHIMTICLVFGTKLIYVAFSYTYSCRDIHIHIRDTYRRNDKDARQNNRRNDKDEGRLLYKNIYLSLYCKGSKRLCGVLLWEGAGDRTYLQYFHPKVMAVILVSFSFSIAAQPEPWSPLCWELAFLTKSRLSPSPTLLACLLLFNSSALYYLQTPTQWYGHASTPPQFLPISGNRNVSLLLSLEWPVWSSSSGNNCHAVQRSLSPGASVYESIKWFFFYLVPFHQPISAHTISSHNCH